MMILALLVVAWTTNDSMRSSEVAVMHGSDAVVRYQARIEEHYLIITAIHKKSWHTYAMDNEFRALDALQGKQSLGIEKGIEIRVEDGLELDGSWLQTKPRDFSKPKLRWFSYGFDQTALFACRVKEVTADQVSLRLKGQACSDETCCNVDITLKLQAANDPIDKQTQAITLQVKSILKDLVPVETRDEATTEEP